MSLEPQALAAGTLECAGTAPKDARETEPLPMSLWHSRRFRAFEWEQARSEAIPAHVAHSRGRAGLARLA